MITATAITDSPARMRSFVIARGISKVLNRGLVQMDKKRQRELVKQQKEAEKKRSKTGMSLKLREVDPPDDLEIEMAQLKEQALRAKAEVKGEPGTEEDKSCLSDLELQITRPPFPPAHVTERLQPAFSGPPHPTVAHCSSLIKQLLIMVPAGASGPYLRVEMHMCMQAAWRRTIASLVASS